MYGIINSISTVKNYFIMMEDDQILFLAKWKEI